MPPGELARATLAERRHAGGGEQALGAFHAVLAGDAEEIGEERDVLVDGQVLVEAEPLRHVAHMRAHALRLGDGVHPLDRDRALVGRHHRGEEAHDGGLAGAVGTDEAEHLARRALEAELVDGDGGAEPFRQSADLDGGSQRRAVHDCPGALTAIFASAGRPGTSSWVGLSMSMRMR